MKSWPAPAIPTLPGRGLAVRALDTATGELRPLAPGPVATLYVCGITPYDATHLGHAATYLTYDTMLRALRDSGHPARYVQNITDVDDPLLARAQQTGEDWRALGRREISLFCDDMAALRLVPPDAFVAVTEAVPLIVAMVQRLMDVGAAYVVDGDVYFSVAAAPRFGEVAHDDRGVLIELSRDHGGDPDRPGKKDPLDPLLWLAARPGEPFWDSPFGPGRPGWHVECSAIAVEHLGATIDVQGGGTDLIFPHHEMSAQHAQVATGQWPFARAYVHQALVGMDGHKMSKSRGNLVFVSQLLAEGVDARAIRLALLAHHHTEEWEWTERDLAVAQQRLATWRRAAGADRGPSAEPVLERVRLAVADGLDTPRALAAVDRWATEAGEHRGRDTAAPALLRATVEALLGVNLGDPDGARGSGLGPVDVDY